MLDIETSDTNPNGAMILQIGAVVFDAAEILAGTELNITPRLAIGSTSIETIQWWMQQSTSAQVAVWSPIRSVGPRKALEAFNQFIEDTKPETIWGNAPTFDVSNLRVLYKILEIDFPFSFRQERCYRTVKALFPDFPDKHKLGYIPHTGLADATRQANHLIQLAKAGLIKL